MNRLTALRSALANLYPTQDDAQRVVADAGLNLAYIRFSDKAINNWNNILLEAEKHDCLDALLEVVLQEYSANPALLKAIQMVDAAILNDQLLHQTHRQFTMSILGVEPSLPAM